MMICASRSRSQLPAHCRAAAASRRDLHHCARQKGSRLGYAWGLEERADVRTVAGVDENLVCGHEICPEPAGALGGWAASLARPGDEVKARALRDDARQPDFLKLSIGRTPPPPHRTPPHS